VYKRQAQSLAESSPSNPNKTESESTTSSTTTETKGNRIRNKLPYVFDLIVLFLFVVLFEIEYTPKTKKIRNLEEELLKLRGEIQLLPDRDNGIVLSNVISAQPPQVIPGMTFIQI
jgi:hypothetical protein